MQGFFHQQYFWVFFSSVMVLPPISGSSDFFWCQGSWAVENPTGDARCSFCGDVTFHPSPFQTGKSLLQVEVGGNGWIFWCGVIQWKDHLFLGFWCQWTCLGRAWVKTAWKPHINIASVITYIYSVNIWNIYIHILISIHLQLQILSWMWSQPPGSMWSRISTQPTVAGTGGLLLGYVSCMDHMSLGDRDGCILKWSTMVVRVVTSTDGDYFGSMKGVQAELEFVEARNKPCLLHRKNERHHETPWVVYKEGLIPIRGFNLWDD